MSLYSTNDANANHLTPGNSRRKYFYAVSRLVDIYYPTAEAVGHPLFGAMILLSFLKTPRHRAVAFRHLVWTDRVCASRSPS